MEAVAGLRCAERASIDIGARYLAQAVAFHDLAHRRHIKFSTGGLRLSVAFGDMAKECGETVHVLQTVQMACPYQACSLQGSRDVSCDSLAANDLGTGSGWQQSRQNWALLAVVGK